MDWFGTEADQTNPVLVVFQSYISSSNALDRDISKAKLCVEYLEALVGTKADINILCKPVTTRDSLDTMNSSKCHMDLLSRYKEVTEQLLLQRKVLCRGDDESSADESKVSRYISYPEHFRRKYISKVQEREIMPWEGSRYIVTLLTSLADKLLLKYCFVCMKSTWMDNKRRLAVVADVEKCRSDWLIQMAFSALKLEYTVARYERLSLAKAIGFWAKCGLVSSLNRWANRVTLVRKHGVMLHIVGQWRDVRVLRLALNTLRNRQRRVIFTANRAAKQLAVIRKTRWTALRGSVKRLISGGGTCGEVTVRSIRKRQSVTRGRQRGGKDEYWSRCEQESAESLALLKTAEAAHEFTLLHRGFSAWLDMVLVSNRKRELPRKAERVAYNTSTALRERTFVAWLQAMNRKQSTRLTNSRASRDVSQQENIYPLLTKEDHSNDEDFSLESRSARDFAHTEIERSDNRHPPHEQQPNAISHVRIPAASSIGNSDSSLSLLIARERFEVNDGNLSDTLSLLRDLEEESSRRVASSPTATEKTSSQHLEALLDKTPKGLTDRGHLTVGGGSSMNDSTLSSITSPDLLPPNEAHSQSQRRLPTQIRVTSEGSAEWNVEDKLEAAAGLRDQRSSNEGYNAGSGDNGTGSENDDDLPLVPADKDTLPLSYLLLQMDRHRAGTGADLAVGGFVERIAREIEEESGGAVVDIRPFAGALSTDENEDMKPSKEFTLTNHENIVKDQVEPSSFTCLNEVKISPSRACSQHELINIPSSTQSVNSEVTVCRKVKEREFASSSGSLDDMYAAVSAPPPIIRSPPSSPLSYRSSPSSLSGSPYDSTFYYDVIIESAKRHGTMQTKAHREAECMRRRRRWRQVVECLHLWKQKTQSRRLLCRVFSVSLTQWENRYYRSSSNFALLRTVLDAWMGVLAFRRERIHHELQLTRALVFRGATLLASTFVMWCSTVKYRKTVRERTRRENLTTLACCWIEWMRLVQSGRVINQQFNFFASTRLRKRMFIKWRSVVQIEKTLINHTRKRLDRLRLQRYLRYWIVAKNAMTVRRKWLILERHELENAVRAMLHTCNASVKKANRTRLFLSSLEKIIIRKKAERAFKKWPGRKESLAASELCRRLSRRKHMREKQKIGMNLKGFVSRMQGEDERDSNCMMLQGEADDGDDGKVDNEAIDKVTVQSLGAGSKAFVHHDGKRKNEPTLNSYGSCLGRMYCVPPQTTPSGSRVVVKGTTLSRSSHSPALYRNVQSASRHTSREVMSCGTSRARGGGSNAESIERRGVSGTSDSSIQKMKRTTDRPNFVLSGSDTHRAPPPLVKRRLGYQERAVEYGYSDGFVSAKLLVTAFLVTVLRSWRDIVSHRRDVRRRELFLKACSKLRRLSEVFYHWLARAPNLSHRTTVWSDSRASTVLSLTNGSYTTSQQHHMARGSLKFAKVTSKR